MNRVDGLEPTRRGVRVIVANTVVATLPESVIAELAVRSGTQWTPELADQAEHVRKVHAACAAAQRLLKLRDRSQAEIRERLSLKGYSPRQIDDAVSRLTRAGLLNDARSAEATARAQTSRTPAARAMITETLESRGFAPRIASRAAQVAAEGQSDRALADRLVKDAIAAAPRGLARDALIRRVFAKLARRGFDEDLSRDAVETHLGPVE